MCRCVRCIHFIGLPDNQSYLYMYDVYLINDTNSIIPSLSCAIQLTLHHHWTYVERMAHMNVVRVQSNNTIADVYTRTVSRAYSINTLRKKNITFAAKILNRPGSYDYNLAIRWIEQNHKIFSNCFLSSSNRNIYNNI